MDPASLIDLRVPFVCLFKRVRNVTAEAVAALRIIERVDEEDAWSDEHNEGRSAAGGWVSPVLLEIVYYVRISPPLPHLALVEALPSFGNVRLFIWTFTTYNIGTCGLVAMARGFVAAAQRLVDWRCVRPSSKGGLNSGVSV